MRILVSNDDGYFAPGIKKLAEIASRFGEVIVVAPEGQCSAMSHRLTITDSLITKSQDIGVPGVPVYSVSGTPADAVRVALDCLCEQQPDIIFSGINKGYNAGYDIVYSGTIGAAMEGLMHGIPAIAFSMEYESGFELVDRYLEEIIADLLPRKLPRNQIWNVNFPAGSVAECKGIAFGVEPAQVEYHDDHYKVTDNGDGTRTMILDGSKKNVPSAESDYGRLLDGYITIGTTQNAVMTE